MIERRAQRMHANARDRAIARLHSDDAVERGGADHRSERLGTERERYKPGGDNGGWELFEAVIGDEYVPMGASFPF